MLVLSRKPNQEILIGENVKLTILRVKGNTVRIGIEAPHEVRVIRGELSTEALAKPAIQAELTVRFSPKNEVESHVDNARILPFETREANLNATSTGSPPSGSEPSSVAFVGSPKVSDCVKLPTNRIQDVLARLARNTDV